MKREKVQRMIEYIEENLNNEISLEHIGREVQYSPYYCSVSFRRFVGTSIKRYILRRRLQMAREELICTSKSIISVAFDYGYSTQEAFSRAFSKEFGLSPNEYRKTEPPVSRYEDKSFNREKNYKVGVNMKENIIDKLQEEIHEKYTENVLHILNGSCMLEEFKRKDLMREGHTYIPFNEAMCWGNGHEELFSERFIENRCSSLKVSREQYREITLDNLKPLLGGEFHTVVLWFGDDMFCQINMLTVLAFLDSMDFEGDVLFCMAIEDGDEMIPNAHPIDIQGKLEIYRSVVCERDMPKEKIMPVMYQGMSKYLGYRDGNSEINRYIREHIKKNRRELIGELFERFPKYGLGDMQYEMMIEKIQADITVHE